MTIVWPEYFNSNLSIKEGRKISKDKCFKNPTTKDIVKALRKLKIQYTVEDKKSYPGKWYENNGRVIIETDKNKREILEEIAQNMKVKN
ncbi:MAG: signal recognition particle subunit SRP19/SEC65 family protein [Methanobacteriaceae archaeon]|jgi:signal recognition particle subunit SRP19|nr:signal recognition particle subunit SRP19/SEC65 family protein [Methanobacteriaceae archaeon]